MLGRLLLFPSVSLPNPRALYWEHLGHAAVRDGNIMKQILPILVAILCVSAVLRGAVADETSRPNIVFVITDDQISG